MIATIRDKYATLSAMMNERMRRRWAACEALAMGRGGISAVARAAGVSPNTIRRGILEIEAELPELAASLEAPERQRIRRPGAGRRRLTEQDRSLMRDLKKLLEPVTRGDPTRPLLWTSKSTRHLAAELQRQGHEVSHMTVARLLAELDYRLQANRKTREGASHPDRDAQFHYINRKVEAFQRRGQPAISVDTKKRELVGDFKNPGREWRPQGQPEAVRVHDFRDPQQGVAVLYGVYDLNRNNGWMSVGIDHDTADRGGDDPALVAKDGSACLPSSPGVVDHGGCGREQRQPLAAVETGSAETGQRLGSDDNGLPFSTGDQQVEQDRAPDVLPRHRELAGPTAGESRRDCQPHWPHQDP